MLTRPTLVVLMLLVSAGSLLAREGATVDFPRTEAGRRAEAYLKAFNSESENDMRAYLEANLTPEALAQRSIELRMQTLRQIRGDAGMIEAAKITGASDDAITVIARSAKGKWLKIAFSFEKGGPHRLLGARFQILDEPPDLDAPMTPLTEAELVKETERYLDAIAEKDEFSGVVLLAMGETPIFQKAYGLASKEYNALNRVDTRFNLGSINKFFTSIAIELLAGMNVISLDDTIGTYLPDYPNKEAAGRVTIRHLLDMTSGIGDFFGNAYDALPKDKIRNLADYLPLFASEPLHFEPGTQTEYSNGGYIVLGLIIEKASGQSYFDYVREHIYKPAGMGNTGHLEADLPTENVASGYTRTWGGTERPGEPRRNNFYTRPARGSSAGGGYSTARDLLRLLLALRTGTLSAPRAAEAAANGMAIAGGAPGINAYVETHPAHTCTVIVLSNYDPPTAGTVGRRIGSFVKRLQ